MTIINVTDPKATAEFYVKAFGFELGMIAPNNAYVDIKEPDLDYNLDMMKYQTTIGFTKKEDFENEYNMDLQELDPTKDPSAIHLTFHSQNVKRDLERALNNGAKLIAETHKTEWTEELAYVSDINGVIIAIAGKPVDMRK